MVAYHVWSGFQWVARMGGADDSGTGEKDVVHDVAYSPAHDAVVVCGAFYGNASIAGASLNTNSTTAHNGYVVGLNSTTGAVLWRVQLISSVANVTEKCNSTNATSTATRVEHVLGRVVVSGLFEGDLDLGAPPLHAFKIAVSSPWM